MFIYLVALAAALFIIFGLVRGRCLTDLLWSPISCPASLYNGLIRRPAIEATLNNDLENTSTTETPWAETNERVAYEELPLQRAAWSNRDGSSDAILGGTGSKARSLNPPRYSFEDILSEERDKDLGFPVSRPIQLGAAQVNALRSSKPEGKDTILESLRSSIERTSTSPYSRLNTSQIYNLILKEKLKENAAKQKLTENDANKFKESSPILITFSFLI
ncbi:uncharacterized protein LOC143369638 isoform X2 [Andrena cerasifolii]|uniref:uncharacterized protein LOC143369638 isoform X2 n=1 Tax=Andrena cerasifolii TaxID=2819439 RepID=UPI004037BFCF